MLRVPGLTCCIALIAGIFPVAAEEPSTQPGALEVSSVVDTTTGPDCLRCHSCDRPTPKDKCFLHSCTRDKAHERHVPMSDDRGPDVVILSELENAYLPVPFDHKGHADMAEMSQGCVTCHHHTPAGQRHPPCRTCHDISSAGTDIYKPGLKGAYHRECVNCHREWIDENNCATCHMPKAGLPKDRDGKVAFTKDEMLGLMHPLGMMHPPIPEPNTETYRAQSGQNPGAQVIFRHQEHVRRFGLRCVECHSDQSCTKCHAKEREPRQAQTLEEHHKPCLRCHADDIDDANKTAGGCKHCHWQADEPKPGRFDHASTGWPLGLFHADNSCRDCHNAVPFTKLDRGCNTCHSAWSPSLFNHGVTGQVLDDNHADHDCEDCHIDRMFARPPTCDQCHDEEDDGIAFPARRPGPFIGLRGQASGGSHGRRHDQAIIEHLNTGQEALKSSHK